MIEELLPYYEKQLQEFGQQSRDFAKKYPKIAQRLSLNQEQIDDPHIERLIQAFSLIAARIDKKLVDGYDLFSRSLFEVMFPQYLRPFPACSVVSFEDVNKQKQLTDVHIVPAQTSLKSRSYKGVQCEFKTSKAVRMLPLQLNHIAFKTNPSAHIHLNQNATLTFRFECFNKAIGLLQQEKLPIYLDAISNFPLQLLDGIFKSDTVFTLKSGQESHAIHNPFAVMGFDESDHLLPIDQHTHHAYRLLTEYFCFPEKFSYLLFDLGILKNLSNPKSEFELQIHLKLNLNDQAVVRNYSELNVANFKLYTTPVINLFKKKSEPQKIDHKQLEYPLITDNRYPAFYQVYSILDMNIIRQKQNTNQTNSYPVLPFFAMSHYQRDDVQFFYTLNPKQYHNQSIETGYTIISKHLQPHEIQSDFISTTLLCSNGELPYDVLSHSNNVLTLNDSTIARHAHVLKRPTMPYMFSQNKQEQWRIISHLSLNTIALMKGDAVSHVKELLELYNLPQSEEKHLIIDSIKDIQFETSHKLVEAKPFPMFVRGVKVKITMNIGVFRGHSIYLFSQLLSHIFSLKVQMNSYVDVMILDEKTGQELYQCIQNIGGKTLL